MQRDGNNLVNDIPKAQQKILEEHDGEVAQIDLLEIEEDNGSSDEENNKALNVTHIKAKPMNVRTS